jgi:hypothetical protein
VGERNPALALKVTLCVQGRVKLHVHVHGCVSFGVLLLQSSAGYDAAGAAETPTQVNTHGIQNVLELAAAHDLKVYAPSTIAVFGPTTPKHATPDDTIMRPTTMYGELALSSRTATRACCCCLQPSCMGPVLTACSCF